MIADQLAELIERLGPLSFETFMEAALYDEGGFFASGRGAGRSGADFITSVETGTLFGVLVAREIDRWWERLGRPDPFVVLDVGAGRGQLARDVLRAGPACASSLRYVLVERSAALRELHRDHLPWEPPEDVLGPGTETDEDREEPEGLETSGGGVAPGTGRVTAPHRGPLVTSLADLPASPIAGVIVANELLDNLPFVLVERTSTGWSEVRVGRDRGRFAECVVPAGPPLADLIGRLLPMDAVPVGARLPIPTVAARWMREARRAVGRGGLVVVDYAAEIDALVARGAQGWLRTYVGHQRGTGPLDDPGLQDITCDLPTPVVVAAALSAGWVLEGAVGAQADWLVDLGIEELAESARGRWTQRAAIGDLAALRDRSWISEAAALTAQPGLGAHRVFTFVTRRQGSSR